MKQLFIILTLSLFIVNCHEEKQVGLTLNKLYHMGEVKRPVSLGLKLQQLPETAFRFPVGDSLGHGYYIAQGFQDPKMHRGDHLGIDISGFPGGDSDLGDTIYSIGYGLVDYIGFNDYMAIYYKYEGKIIRVVYFHCLEMFPEEGNYVSLGQSIATIGNSNGQYQAHLHLEFIVDTTIYSGFYGDPTGFMDPMEALPHYTK